MLDFQQVAKDIKDIFSPFRKLKVRKMKASLLKYFEKGQSAAGGKRFAATGDDLLKAGLFKDDDSGVAIDALKECVAEGSLECRRGEYHLKERRQTGGKR